MVVGSGEWGSEVGVGTLLQGSCSLWTSFSSGKAPWFSGQLSALNPAVSPPSSLACVL